MPTPRSDGRERDIGLEEAVQTAKALADPIRLRMLALMAAGRAQCCPPDPPRAGRSIEAAPEGICVCELQDLVGLSQSRTSYHLRVLRDAGLVHETARGKWNFYGLDHEALDAGLTALRAAIRG